MPVDRSKTIAGVTMRELRRLCDAAWTDLTPGVPAWSGTRLVTVEIDDGIGATMGDARLLERAPQLLAELVGVPR